MLSRSCHQYATLMSACTITVYPSTWRQDVVKGSGKDEAKAYQLIEVGDGVRLLGCSEGKERHR